MPATSSEPAVSLELRIRPGPETVVLHCAGQIVAGDTSQAFKSAAVDLLHGHRNVVVDLSGVNCMDRNGLETIVSLYSAARMAKARITFENLRIDVSESRLRSSHLHKFAD